MTHSLSQLLFKRFHVYPGSVSTDNSLGTHTANDRDAFSHKPDPPKHVTFWSAILTIFHKRAIFTVTHNLHVAFVQFGKEVLYSIIKTSRCPSN